MQVDPSVLSVEGERGEAQRSCVMLAGILHGG